MGFAFRFGIEEEFFLCDPSGRGRQKAPAEFWKDLIRIAPGASKELLQNQVETHSSPCPTHGAALAELIERRLAVMKIAAQYDLRLMASGTHPTVDWRHAIFSTGDRYSALKRDMRMLGWRNMYCGMHVHVETPDGIDRVRIINRCTSFLPLFLALSVSSPFWCGEWTGMYGYRLSGYDELPRTGMPPVLADEAAFGAYAAALQRAGLISDPSFIWWAIRPSAKFPTIELRICDSATNVRHSTAIGSLFRALVRRLCLDDAFGPAPSPFLRSIADENRWQAQCHGSHAVMVDPQSLEPETADVLIRRLCADLGDDLDALSATVAVSEIESILTDGASAEHQVTLMQEKLVAGVDLEGALAAVNEHLVKATAKF